MALELLYFANPMCSWCWGMAPVLQAVRERRPSMPITVATGSMGVDRARPMTEADKAKVRSHWQHVIERTGQPFDMGFFDREGFVYDTALPCRALAIVREQYAQLALPFLHRLQERFYAGNEDITDDAVLADAAGEFGLERDAFLSRLHAPEVAQEIEQEWQATARLGVTGYPTVLALGAERPQMIALGYRPMEEVEAALAAVRVAA